MTEYKGRNPYLYLIHEPTRPDLPADCRTCKKWVPEVIYTSTYKGAETTYILGPPGCFHAWPNVRGQPCAMYSPTGGDAPVQTSLDRWFA